MYKDDLARVIDVDYSTGRATIEVVPRIDYTTLAGGKEKQMPFGRTPTVRPAPRCAGPSTCPRNCMLSILTGSITARTSSQHIFAK